MRTYKPTKLFNLAFELFTPTTVKINGVETKDWGEPVDTIFGSYVTYGGTDREVNGVTVTADTGIIETWYDDRIKADCRLRNVQTDVTHEIMGQPENIEGRNQYLRLRVEAIKGGA